MFIRNGGKVIGKTTTTRRGGGGGLERFRKGKEEGKARKRAKLTNKKEGSRSGHARRQNCVDVNACVRVCCWC